MSYSTQNVTQKVYMCVFFHKLVFLSIIGGWLTPNTLYNLQQGLDLRCNMFLSNNEKKVLKYQELIPGFEFLIYI